MKKSVFMMMAVAGVLFASCASKKELANCQTENKSLTESLQAAKEDLAGNPRHYLRTERFDLAHSGQVHHYPETCDLPGKAEKDC